MVSDAKLAFGNQLQFCKTRMEPIHLLKISDYPSGEIICCLAVFLSLVSPETLPHPNPLLLFSIHARAKRESLWFRGKSSSWTSRPGALCGLPRQGGENGGGKVTGKGKGYRSSWDRRKENKNGPHPWLHDLLHEGGPTMSGPHGSSSTLSWLMLPKTYC